MLTLSVWVIDYLIMKSSVIWDNLACCLKSLTTSLVVQQLDQANHKENIKAVLLFLLTEIQLNVKLNIGAVSV